MQSAQVERIRRPTVSPFLKWAGGKTQLLAELAGHVPEFDRYFEPFLGGGAFFFYLSSSHARPFRAHLSDVNWELVNSYQMVKSDVDGLIRHLRRHEMAYGRNPRAFYYALRSSMPAEKLQRAARLVALNKTCYNGLYRVNSTGEFNVPIGRYSNPSICNELQLRNASSVLRRTRASIRACDYTAALEGAGRGDFVYLDPPFVPLTKTANFVSYTQGGFTADDQVALADAFTRLHERGCRVLLSNSDTPLTRKLYSGFDQFTVKASRAINCRGDGRSGCTELLVRNYTP